MKHTSIRRRLRALTAGATVACTLTALPGVAVAASSWNPTLLVNTEAFQVIDEGDSSTNIELRFGSTVNETLLWNRSQGMFQFTDDLSVQGTLSGSRLRVDGNADIWGNLSASGSLSADTTINAGTSITAGTNVTAGGRLSGASLRVSGGGAEIQSTLTVSGAVRTDNNFTINDDQTAADAVFTFGSDVTNETLTFANTLDRFEFSDDLFVFGLLSGSTLRISGNADINGALAVTGAVRTDSNITINDDGTAADAVLTFGNDAGNETITFSDAFNEFSVSDDLRVTGNLSGSGNLNLEGNLTGATIRGFGLPGGGCTGTANKLTWNAATGKFECATDETGTIGNGSGFIISLHPEYANAVYFSSGASFVGQLSASGGTTELDNSYIWTSTKAGIQDYWISVRVRLPDNFSSWDPVKPIEMRYKTGVASNANNHVTVRIKDTAGAVRALTNGGALSSTSWTTANITGPEAGGTWTPKGYITVYVKLAANNTAGAKALAGYLNLNYETTTP